jgi:hypothetical protein
MSYDIKRIDSAQLPALGELVRLIYGSAAPTSLTLPEKFDTKSFGAEFVGYAAYDPKKSLKLGELAVPVAYYGVFPTVMKFGDTEVLCAQSGDTMTHETHRGKGLFIELARKTYATAREEGIQFVFGFPSESSYPGFERKLEWHFPYHMRRFSRFVPTIPIGILLRKVNHPVNSIGRYGVAIASSLFDLASQDDELWERTESSQSAAVRDRRLWDYKSKNKLFLKFEDIGFVIKYDGDLSIGDIFGNPTLHQMNKVMFRLSLLAMAIGANRVRSYFSPESHLGSLLKVHGSITKSLPYGFVNFNCAFDPSDLELVFLDYDTF